MESFLCWAGPTVGSLNRCGTVANVEINKLAVGNLEHKNSAGIVYMYHVAGHSNLCLCRLTTKVPTPI